MMEKTPDFDYTCIPHDYAHCFNHECPAQTSACAISSV